MNNNTIRGANPVDFIPKRVVGIAGVYQSLDKYTDTT